MKKKLEDNNFKANKVAILGAGPVGKEMFDYARKLLPSQIVALVESNKNIPEKELSNIFVLCNL